ncbi:MAG TPA: protein translocase subunit SecF, partial [Candidatus Marinimicrobia bacterium]|nr:protein translocase subunit SecF [Candidatus Neomarinimicrobiota bacterium]
MRLIKETHIKFMDQRRFAFILSAVVILAGLGSLVFQGGPKLSIDFKGGTMIAVTFNEEVDITQVRTSLSLVNVEGQT